MTVHNQGVRRLVIARRLAVALLVASNLFGGCASGDNAKVSVVAQWRLVMGRVRGLRLYGLTWI